MPRKGSGRRDTVKRKRVTLYAQRDGRGPFTDLVEKGNEAIIRGLARRLARLPGVVINAGPDGRLTVTTEGIVIARLMPRPPTTSIRLRRSA